MEELLGNFLIGCHELKNVIRLKNVGRMTTFESDFGIYTIFKFGCRLPYNLIILTHCNRIVYYQVSIFPRTKFGSLIVFEKSVGIFVSKIIQT